MEPSPIVLAGEWRPGPGEPSTPCRVELGPATFAIAPGAGGRLEPAYRDVLRLTASPFGCALELDGGPAVELLRFGPSLELLVSTIRERRTRQLLEERLVQVPDEPLETLEAATGGWSGRAHVVRHPWGLALVPLEPEAPPLLVRRAAIGEVVEDLPTGRVTIRTGPDAAIELRRLGGHARRHADAVRELAGGAAADAAAIVGTALADAPFGLRARLAGLLVDGRPTPRAAIGDAWPETRDAFARTGDVAEYLERLEARAGAEAATWIAVAPERPGTPEPRAWFFVALPRGLVAMEVVTPGAHATYLFRSAPAAAEALVTLVSEALVDLRFLREPIALPAGRLAGGGHRDYRRVVTALPSVARARERFVGRLVHDAGWPDALDDLLRWAGANPEGEWPGRSAQEARIDESSEDDGAGETASPGTTDG